MVTPRAAAAAVIGMLGFGVVLGALVGGGEASAFRRLIVDMPARQSQSATASGGGSASGGSPSASAAPVRTVTVISGGGAPPTPAIAAGPGTGTPSGSPRGSKGPSGPLGGLPPIKHVFLIMLSQQGYAQTFGNTTSDPYLAGTLASQGLVAQFYYAVAASPLANEIGLVSGQGPTPQTLANCPVYGKIAPGKQGPYHQILGHGCVYPKTTQTLADQLTAAKQTWRVYLQAATSGKAKPSPTEGCAPKLGKKPRSGGHSFAAWRNPFLNFQATTRPGSCSKNNVSLSELAQDLKSPKTTPALSYIVPDLCDDGSSTPCKPHAPDGMAAADAFLKSVVPKIEASPAYKADGLIAITFDEAPQSGPGADPSSCCHNPTYPNLPPPKKSTGCGTPTTTTTTPTTTSTTTTTPTTTTSCPPSSSGFGFGESKPTGGGGQVGLLLISPYVVPASQDLFDYLNHFSLLASLEDIFGLKRLGYAQARLLPVFVPGMFKNYLGCPTAGKAPPC